MANVSLLGALGGLEGSGLSFRNKLINGNMSIDHTTLAHSKVQMGGFTGGVDGRGSILLNDCLQASAEL